MYIHNDSAPRAEQGSCRLVAARARSCGARWQRLRARARYDRPPPGYPCPSVDEQARNLGRGHFEPVPGFVVKTALRGPWTPPVGSDRKVAQEIPAGTKVFVNVCHHEGVPPPIDQVRLRA